MNIFVTAFFMACLVILQVYPSAHADSTCDKAGADAATQCVKNRANTFMPGTASEQDMQNICLKEGRDAKDKCEKDRKAGAVADCVGIRRGASSVT